MNRFTIIRLQEPSVLHFDYANRAREIKLVAELINGDATNTVVENPQMMTANLKDRLCVLDKIGEKSYNVKKFFQEIPNGQYFLFLSSHIEDEFLIYQFHVSLAQLNQITEDPSPMDRIYSYLGGHYELRAYSGKERRQIGVYDKKKRVCRFCGRSIPEVSFKHKSHAISESIGNKGLICLEECDDCNKRFNESLEQDIFKLFGLNLLLNGVTGKRGVPTLKGDGISIKNETSSCANLGRDTIVYTLRDMPNTRDLQELVKGISREYELHTQFIPQNVYKCLCKFVLSLVDSSEIQYFRDTITWINEPLSKHRLPPIWSYSVNPQGKRREQSSSMIVMRRKHSFKELPYCWAIITIAGECLLFIVPFCSLDTYKFINPDRQAFFIDGIKKMMPEIDFKSIDMTGTTPAKMRISTSFEISPDCIEGRDYCFIDSGNKSL